MEHNDSYGLYKVKATDFTKQPMFFGSDKNTQRFDIMKYPWYDKNNNDQQGNDWAWDEVTVDTDIRIHETMLSKSQQFVLRRGLQRAILLDSLNGRGPVFMFGQVANLPELEAAIITWDHFEVNKHSRTYTKHLRALYADPEEVFDESFTVPELVKVAESISSVYNDCYYNVINWIYKQQRNIPMSSEEMDELYRTFLMAWIEVNALEGMRFYPFFASLWAMDHTEDYMKELSEDIVFIARDENEHLKLTQYTINIFKKALGEGFVEVFKKMSPDIKDRYHTIYHEECESIDHSFQYGGYPGMNAALLKDYTNYCCVRRMRAIGIEPDANSLGGKLVEKNPLPWTENYIHNDEEEKLPQQQNVLNYKANAVRDDLADYTSLDFVQQLTKRVK